jgi:hypothetical protein
MLCRKVLMSIAVEKGASEGLRFIEYVNYLEANGYVPPGGKGWVDAIRKQGNDANHKIAPMIPSDASTLIEFTAMLLKIVYEFPARGPQP